MVFFYNIDKINLKFDLNLVIFMLFTGATSFNQPLNWDTSKVTNMRSMFTDAISFDQPIRDWDTSNVTNMNSLCFYMLNHLTKI